MEYSGLAYPRRPLARGKPGNAGTRDPVALRQDRIAAGGRPRRPHDGRAPYYRAELKKSRTAIDYLKGRGLSGEGRREVRPGIRARGLAELEAVFPDYAAADLKDTGLVIDTEAAEASPRGATIASATA